MASVEQPLNSNVVEVPPQVESMAMGDRSAMRPVSVTVKGLNYSVPAKTKTQKVLAFAFDVPTTMSPTGRPVDKKENIVELLRDIDLVARPGQLIAILGPSGSGKTTLLNHIASRADKGMKTGVVKFNGRELSSKETRSVLSLVMASDRHLPYLTLEETLQSAAKFQLPFSSAEQRQARVDKVIEDVGLGSGRSHRVGGVLRKGLSSGQMRRLSIAVELLNNPAVLVLDEPTSGLDAALAAEVVLCLKRMAIAGRTVICTVHQPRSSVFYLFDRICLMSCGQILYQGSPTDAQQYFETQGYKFAENSNHSDVLLDIATPISLDQLDAPIMRDGVIDTECKSLEEMLQFYQKSSARESVLREIDLEHQRGVNPTELRQDSQWFDPLDYSPTRIVKETWGVAERTFWNSFRNPLACGVIILVQALMGLLLGSILYNEPGTYFPETAPPNVNSPDSAISQWLAGPGFTAFEEGVDGNGTHPLLFDIINGVDGKGSNPINVITNETTLLPMFHSFVHCMYDDLELARYYPQADFSYLNPLWDQYESDQYNQKGETTTPPPSTTSNGYPNYGEMNPPHALSDLSKLLQVLDWSMGKFDWPGIHHYCYDAAQKPTSDPEWQMYYLCLMCWPDTRVFLDTMVRCMEWVPLPGMVAMYPICKAKNYQHPNRRLLEETDKKLALIFDQAMPRAFRGMRNSFIDTPRSLAAYTLEEKETSEEYFPTPYSSYLNNKLTHALGSHQHTNLGALQDGSSSSNATTAPPSQVMTDWIGPTGMALIDSLGNLGNSMMECDHDFCRDKKAAANDPNTTSALAGKEFSEYGMVTACVMNLAGCLFFAAASVGFASYDALISFPMEKVLFNRETANGLYRPSTYFIGKNLADLLFQVVPSICLVSVFYFMTGVNQYQDVGKFFKYVGICALLCWCAYGFAYMLSALSPKVEIAVVLAPLFLVVILACGGFFIRDDAVPGWAVWAKWLSFYRWGFFALMTSEYPPGGFYGGVPNTFTLAVAGVTELRCWVNCCALVCLAVGYRIFAFIFLKFLHRKVGLES